MCPFNDAKKFSKKIHAAAKFGSASFSFAAEAQSESELIRQFELGDVFEI